MGKESQQPAGLGRIYAVKVGGKPLDKPFPLIESDESARPTEKKKRLMNNRMRLDNFFAAGGVVEIWLQGCVRRVGCDTYFSANSLMTADKLGLRLSETETELKKILKRDDICIDNFIDCISFTWNRTTYELEIGHPSLKDLFVWLCEDSLVRNRKPYYLVATGTFL